jgi:arylsulfatase A-like enzyme
MYLGMEEVVAHSGFGRMEDAGAIGGNRNSSFGIDEPSTVHRVLAWVDALPRGRRFFAAYLPVAGHHPYAHTEPGPFPDSAEVDRYRNALHEGDRALGTLLEGLRARGLADSTLVVVIADHGEAFGQHEGNYGHTLALYDENVRVPLVVSLPGGATAGRGPRRVHRVASLLDVAPTILDLAGVRSPAAFDGESLLTGGARAALFFTDYSLGLVGLRDGCTKYLHELESGRSRWFDVCRDPDERIDLMAGRADRAARYRERLRSWSAAEVARIGR